MCVCLCGEPMGHSQLSNKSLWSKQTHMQRGDVHMVGKTKKHVTPEKLLMFWNVICEVRQDAHKKTNQL